MSTPLVLPRRHADPYCGSVKYFAYGSNMDVDQMKCRCPDAKALDVAVLVGCTFRINRYGMATVVPSTSRVHGLLWEISASDENSLSRYEGEATEFYLKESVWVEAPTLNRVTATKKQLAIIDARLKRWENVTEASLDAVISENEFIAARCAWHKGGIALVALWPSAATAAAAKQDIDVLVLPTDNQAPLDELTRRVLRVKTAQAN